ncbi:MAG: ATP-binding protein, partial [Desulfarculaceae bacterium]
RRLGRRMTLIALLLALVPLYLLGAGIYMYFSNIQEKQIRAEIRNLALNRVSAIRLFLDERTSMLEVLAYNSSRAQLTEPGRLDQVFRLLNRHSWSFLDLGVIGVEGRHLGYVGPYPLEDRNYSDAKWFQQTMLRGFYISDVFLGFRGTPHFVVAVKHPAGKQSWILRATIDSDVFTRLVRSAQLGERGDAYIVNAQGRYQTPPRFGGSIMQKSQLDMARVPRGVNVVDRNSPGGKRLLTAFAWLPGNDWLLVIDQDPAEALGHINLAREVELAVLAVATLFIAASITFLVRLMVRRLEAQDAERSALDAQLAHSGRLVSLGRMAAGVAHEINNPLAAIGELAGLLEDVAAQDEKLKESKYAGLFRENLTKIQGHVERVRGVTHRLLGFARRMEPHLDAIEVNQVLEEAFSFLEKEAILKRVDVSRELAPDLPTIQSDRAQLQQVFLNLLNNALDAVSEGDSIDIRSWQEDGMVMVSIADNGPGIPDEVADSIFDPFFTTKEPGEGTGLGLSISHSIMQKLGGTLTFKSTPGRGATFYVGLPAA